MNTDSLPYVQGGQGREGWALYKQALQVWPGLARITVVSLMLTSAVLVHQTVQKHRQAVKQLETSRLARNP